MSEAQIIEGCRQGDRIAQRELVQRYSPVLLTVARRYTADRPTAEDLLQDSLVKALQGISSYKGTGTFLAWLRRIVVNRALQRLNKRSVQRELSGLEKMPERSINPVALDRLQEEDLLRLVQALAPGLRTVFNLYAIEGYKHTEIAQMLKLSESGVRAQYSRARIQLQQAITKLQNHQSHVG
ncbi:MAG: RNA polymerase sigma factor [Bacteroidota bacterium]